MNDIKTGTMRSRLIPGDAVLKIFGMQCITLDDCGKLLGINYIDKTDDVHTIGARVDTVVAISSDGKCEQFIPAPKGKQWEISELLLFPWASKLLLRAVDKVPEDKFKYHVSWRNLINGAHAHSSFGTWSEMMMKYVDGLICYPNIVVTISRKPLSENTGENQ